MGYKPMGGLKSRSRIRPFSSQMSSRSRPRGFGWRELLGLGFPLEAKRLGPRRRLLGHRVIPQRQQADGHPQHDAHHADVSDDQRVANVA